MGSSWGGQPRALLLLGHVGAELAIGVRRMAAAGLCVQWQGRCPPSPCCRLGVWGPCILSLFVGLGFGSPPCTLPAGWRWWESPEREPVLCPCSRASIPAGLSTHRVILPREGPPTWTRLPRLPSAPSPITTCMPRSRYHIPCPHRASAGPLLTPCLPQPRCRPGT